MQTPKAIQAVNDFFSCKITHPVIVTKQEFDLAVLQLANHGLTNVTLGDTVMYDIYKAMHTNKEITKARRIASYKALQHIKGNACHAS